MLTTEQKRIIDAVRRGEWHRLYRGELRHINIHVRPHCEDGTGYWDAGFNLEDRGNKRGERLMAVSIVRAGLPNGRDLVRWCLVEICRRCYRKGAIFADCRSCGGRGYRNPSGEGEWLDSVVSTDCDGLIAHECWS